MEFGNKIKYKLLIISVLFLILFMKITKSSLDFNLHNIAYDLGINYIKMVKNNNLPGKCVMFDIDDTLLYVNNDGTFTPIKPMIKLLNEARKNKMKILIITARDSIATNQTINDLEENDIYYDYLYLRENPKDNYQLFKSDIKKKYMDLYGLNIVMSIGDNDLDIIGPYSGYCIKLPNKKDPRLFHNYYGILENVIP